MNLYIAILRKKDNNHISKDCVIRHIIRDDADDLNILKVKIKNRNKHGLWRIYKTINSRDTKKALDVLRHKIIVDANIHERFESEWKTALMQPKCKAENNILIDIDTKSATTFAFVYDSIVEDSVLHIGETPNGIHLVIKNQDVRHLSGYDNIEVKRDAIYLLETLEV